MFLLLNLDGNITCSLYSPCTLKKYYSLHQRVNYCRYLPHWDHNKNLRYPTDRRHVPPADIGASYYPLLGPYSSRDPDVIDQHMYDIRRARIGTRPCVCIIGLRLLVH